MSIINQQSVCKIKKSISYDHFINIIHIPGIFYILLEGIISIIGMYSNKLQYVGGNFSQTVHSTLKPISDHHGYVLYRSKVDYYQYIYLQLYSQH